MRQDGSPAALEDRSEQVWAGMTFRDQFSAQAAAYATFRPTYPPTLFAYLAELTPRHDLAWDCGTGSGQAAVALAPYFSRVVASDASAAQLTHARPHPSVAYTVARAEASGLPDAVVDLLTVAQALHWFDLDAFYNEAQRVLAPGGVIAVWGYGDPSLDEPALDRVLTRFNRHTMGPYWPPERGCLVGHGYRDLPFPFAEIEPPTFTLERAWTVGELTGYLRTWSATLRYVTEHGQDPVDDAEAELRSAWGEPPDARHMVRWPFTLRVGQVRSDA